MKSNTYTVGGKEFELQHYGVKGMKWGRRKARLQAIGDRFRRGAASAKDAATKGLNKAKKQARKVAGTELAKRGKSAIDVLMNGDKDWMGNSTVSDDVCVEAKNRGKAALERLMYSQERIDNKKFYGTYDPFD